MYTRSSRTNQIINSIMGMLAVTSRPLNSRAVVKKISLTYGFPRAACWGVVSGLSRSGRITWYLRQPSGPSLFR